MKTIWIISLSSWLVFFIMLCTDIPTSVITITNGVLVIIYSREVFRQLKKQGNIKFGTTRIVYLLGNYAFKFPRITTWSIFLQGLIGNMQETLYSRKINRESKLCPILFSVYGGFLNIMPRCEAITEHEFNNIVFKDTTFEEWTLATIIETDDYHVTVDGLPIENKLSSFGKLNGQLVAVDYGSWDRINYKTKL